MSLIDKAIGRLHQQSGTKPPTPSSKSSESVRKKKATKPIELSPSPTENRSKEFRFNFSDLSKRGFITPDGRRSRISEEFRLIKRRLMQRMSLDLDGSSRTMDRNRGRGHVLMITSSRPAEGKSFVALNLALSLALDEGLHTLLVDADSLRPSLSRSLGVPAETIGLTDLLSSSPPPISDTLLRAKDLPITLLPSGRTVESATDLFSGNQMKNLVEDLASRYSDRIIIFDTPPLLASTEPAALAQHVGQIVLILDAEHTSRLAARSALELLGPRNDVSLVLNKTLTKAHIEQFGSYYETYSAD